MSSDQANHTELPLPEALPNEQQLELQQLKSRVFSLVSVLSGLTQERDLWMNMKMRETRRIRDLESDLHITTQYKDQYKSQMDLYLEEKQKLAEEVQNLKGTRDEDQKKVDLLEKLIKDLEDRVRVLDGEKQNQKETILELEEKFRYEMAKRSQSKSESAKGNFKQIEVTTKKMKNLSTLDEVDAESELVLTTPQGETDNLADGVGRVQRGSKRRRGSVGKEQTSNKKPRVTRTPLPKVQEEQDSDEQEYSQDESQQKSTLKKERRVQVRATEGSQSKYNLRSRS